MKYEMLYYQGKRPNNSKDKLIKELLNYIKEETDKKHFPSRRELEKKFHFQLDEGIESFYKSAGISYKLSQNQEIKTLKANLLLNLIVKNLNKLNLELIQYKTAHERGIDILAKEKEIEVGIEIKAYNTYEKLKQRDINQVLKFIKNEQLKKALLVTTTDISDKGLKIPDIITLIRFKQLKEIVSKEELKDLDYIRNFSVNLENTQKEEKKQRILNYVFSKYKTEGKKPDYNEILKILHLNVYTYFNSLSEIYKILRIPPPLKKMRGKGSKTPDNECIILWKEAFKKYIIESIEKGKKYPSGEEIAQHFGISHIWNITKVSDLYRELGLKPYLEREKRTTSVQES